MNFERPMNEKFIRVAVCDCNNGRFLTSITKLEMNFIFEVLVKASVENFPEWSNDSIKENAVKVVGELKDYMDRNA